MVAFHKVFVRSIYQRVYRYTAKWIKQAAEYAGRSQSSQFLKRGSFKLKSHVSLKHGSVVYWFV